MELANGGELFDRIKLDCGAREATAKLFFQQLLRGVMHCHQHGVCHRDLKPEVSVRVYDMFSQRGLVC
jgi:serine/threonine protein kinase